MTRVAHRRMLPLQTRHLTVTSVHDLGGGLRRVHLAVTGAPVPWTPLGVGDHVKVVLPQEGSGRLRLPGPGEGRPTWPEGPPVLRDYTVAGVAAGGSELVLEMLAHGAGPAGRWAAAAAPGAVLGSLGPRGTVAHPDGYPHYLCVGDLSAAPALARWLREAPPTARVDVVLRSPAPAPLLPRHPRGRLHRTGSAEELLPLVDRLRPDGDTYVWAAGEAGEMATLRRHLRGPGGPPREQVQVDGYWRRGVAGRDHHEALDPAAPDD